MGAKLPPGCSINWHKDPNKTIKLLDWLDQNPVERRILFSSNRGEFNISKSDCGAKAAIAIFSADENPLNRAGVCRDSTPFGQAVMSHIRNGLTNKYQAFNTAIGPVAARMRYEDLPVGCPAYQKVEKQLASEQFPLWKRLHMYWRNLPQFNQYCAKSKSSCSQNVRKKAKGTSRSHKSKSLHSKKQSAAKPARIKSRSISIDSDEVIIVEDTPTPKDVSESEDDAQNDDDFKIRRSKRNLKRSRDEFEDAITTVQSSSKKFNPKGDLSAVHRHELRMAEIQLERQKLALQAQEKKAAAEIRRLELEAEERRRADVREREKERHDVMMRFMGMDTSKGK